MGRLLTAVEEVVEDEEQERDGKGSEVQAEVISLFEHSRGPQAPLSPSAAPPPPPSSDSAAHPLPLHSLHPPAHPECSEGAVGEGSVVWVCVRVKNEAGDGFLHPSKLQGLLALHRSQVSILASVCKCAYY